MTRDSGAPAAGGGGGGGGGGEGARRCSHCGHHGHNARTCTGRPVRLFGVRISDKPIRKSASMGNIAHLAASAGSPEAEGAGAAGAREDGYGSEDLEGNNPSSRRERKRGEAWTEEEHKKFLVGLNALGKGDWRGISRNYVVTRTPTQVASHAQKYFLRQTNLHRRKRRSSLFDMPADQQLSRTSSQELEERLKNPQSIAAPVTTPPGTTPMLAPVPMNVPMPVLAPQPEEQKSTSLSSNNGEAGIPRPEAVPSYGYPMMFPPPYYPPAFIPVLCYYMPVLYGPQDIAHPSPQVVKPLAVHSKPPVNVEDLYSMYALSLRGESNVKNGVPALPLPPKAVGTSERRSAFHGKGPADGASSGVCFA